MGGFDMGEIKFVWNGIRVDGKLYRAWYSESALKNHEAGTITIYARDYKSLPSIAGLTIQNETDMMTDYFEKDKVRVVPSHPMHTAIHAAMKQMDEHNTKKYAKRYS